VREEYEGKIRELVEGNTARMKEQQATSDAAVAQCRAEMEELRDQVRPHVTTQFDSTPICASACLTPVNTYLLHRHLLLLAIHTSRERWGQLAAAARSAEDAQESSSKSRDEVVDAAHKVPALARALLSLPHARSLSLFILWPLARLLARCASPLPALSLSLSLIRCQRAADAEASAKRVQKDLDKALKDLAAAQAAATEKVTCPSPSPLA